MLFMVMERFDPGPVGERFRRCGRMMPEGVEYIQSWIDTSERAPGLADGRVRCFQLMEAPDAASLRPWIDAWADLGEFEVVAVVASQGYWGSRRSGESGGS
jgi:hypothetical protein